MVSAKELEVENLAAVACKQQHRNQEHQNSNKLACPRTKSCPLKTTYLSNANHR